MLTLLVALELLLLAFLLALQELLFAPDPLFGVGCMALWRQNRSGAHGRRLNGYGTSRSRGHRRERGNR